MKRVNIKQAGGVLAAWSWLLLPLLGWGGEPMSLPGYLEEVKSKNQGLAALQADSDVLQRKLTERNLLTSPYFFTEGQLAGDKSESMESMMYGDTRYRNQLDLGLEQRTGFGLGWRLAHQTYFTSVENANPLYVPVSKYYSSKTGLELSQDLWRNAFGKEVMAAANAMEAQTRSSLLEREHQIREIVVAAESVYWKLVLARENVRIQQELLDRAQRLAKWVSDRVDIKLQDPSDLMQAKSQVQLRSLSLSQAQDQERMTNRAFNLMRGINSDVVSEFAGLPSAAELGAPPLPETTPLRKDIAALEWMRIAAEREATRKRENLQPELQARAGMYFNGLDENVSPAVRESAGSQFPSYAIGLGLRMPLDYFSRQPLSEGYAKEAETVAKQVAQKQLEADTEWQELRRQLRENQDRLKIVQELEQLQKKKADHERVRLKRGNSVTFQVLQFEQDWGESQLARLGVENTILELLAKIKLYGE